MKNRGIVVVAIMLVAVLCLGVGYAALNDAITATGTVNVTATGFDLQWENDDTSPIGTSANGNTLTFTVDATKLVKANDSVTIKAKVKNASTENFIAKITDVRVTQSTSYSAYYSVAIAGIAVNDEIAKDANKEVTITVTLKQMPVEDITNDTFEIVIDAEAVVPTT